MQLQPESNGKTHPRAHRSPFLLLFWIVLFCFSGSHISLETYHRTYSLRGLDCQGERIGKYFSRIKLQLWPCENPSVKLELIIMNYTDLPVHTNDENLYESLSQWKIVMVVRGNVNIAHIFSISVVWFFTLCSKSSTGFILIPAVFTSWASLLPGVHTPHSLPRNPVPLA